MSIPISLCMAAKATRSTRSFNRLRDAIWFNAKFGSFTGLGCVCSKKCRPRRAARIKLFHQIVKAFDDKFKPLVSGVAGIALNVTPTDVGFVVTERG